MEFSYEFIIIDWKSGMNFELWIEMKEIDPKQIKIHRRLIEPSQMFEDTHGGVFSGVKFWSLVILHCCTHYSDVIMSLMMSQITDVLMVYSTVCSGTDQRKHQSFTQLAFVRRIHHWSVDSPHKGPLTRKMFSFDDVIMICNMVPTILTVLYEWNPTILNVHAYMHLKPMSITNEYFIIKH